MSAAGSRAIRALRSRRWVWPAWLAPAALVVCSVVALLPAAPFLLPIPGVEQGSYQYAGSLVLEGKVPYLDFWNNHPPLLVFLNAFGLWMGGPAGWGIWMVQLAALVLASLALFAFLHRFFGLLPALFAVPGLQGSLFLLQKYGGAPESYGILFQILIYLLLARMLSRERRGWLAVAAGASAGLAASLRLTLAGVGLIAALVLVAAALHERKARRLLDLAGMAAGFGLVWGAWLLYLAVHRALPAFWEQVFVYQSATLAAVTHPDRLRAIGEVLERLVAGSGFVLLGLLAWAAVLPFLFFNEERVRRFLTGRWPGAFLLAAGLLLVINGLFDDRTGRLFSPAALSAYRVALIGAGVLLGVAAWPFLLGWVRRWAVSFLNRYPPGRYAGLLLPLSLALVDLPAQVLLAGLAGRGEDQRFLLILPPLAILIAFLVWSMSLRKDTPPARSQAAWLAALAIPVLLAGWAPTLAAIRPVDSPQTRRIITYIQASTRPGDRILQWGEDPRVYLLSGRPAASRYATQAVLFSPGYTWPDLVQAFLSDLQDARPVLLVDTRDERMPLPVASPEACSQLDTPEALAGLLRAERDARFPQQVDLPLPYYPAEIAQVYRWVCDHYERVEGIDPDPDAWRVYRWRGEAR